MKMNTLPKELLELIASYLSEQQHRKVLVTVSKDFMFLNRPFTWHSLYFGKRYTNGYTKMKHEVGRVRRDTHNTLKVLSSPGRLLLGFTYKERVFSFTDIDDEAFDSLVELGFTKL